jgi:hypothetical protein
MNCQDIHYYCRQQINGYELNEKEKADFLKQVMELNTIYENKLKAEIEELEIRKLEIIRDQRFDELRLACMAGKVNMLEGLSMAVLYRDAFDKEVEKIKEGKQENG